MCSVKTPKVQPAPAARQGERAPGQDVLQARSQSRMKRRFSFASSVLTPQLAGLGPASTTGTSLLGA